MSISLSVCQISLSQSHQRPVGLSIVLIGCCFIRTLIRKLGYSIAFKKAIIQLIDVKRMSFGIKHIAAVTFRELRH